jgi:hypothetical protein
MAQKPARETHAPITSKTGVSAAGYSDSSLDIRVRAFTVFGDEPVD